MERQISRITQPLALVAILTIGLGLLPLAAQANQYGTYVGTVQTEWLNDSAGRRMRLLSPFTYIDPKGTKWEAPKDWVVDGASIPRIAWSIIGGPFEGRYRDASVIHDVACDKQNRPWGQVHEAFYWAMLASSVNTLKAKIMYAAVYHFGPRWETRLKLRGMPADRPEIVVAAALRGAAKGSEAKIVSIRRKSKWVTLGGAKVLVPTQDAEIEALISPPQSHLSEAEFEALKHRIEEAEGNVDGVMTLKEIREYSPALGQ